MQYDQQHVDQFNADKRNHDSTHPIDQQVTSQQRTGSNRTIRKALQGERNERDNDQRVKDDGGQDRTVRCRQMHDIQRIEGWIRCRKSSRNNRKVFGNVVSDAECGQCTSRHQ